MAEEIDNKNIKVLHTECTASFGGQEIRIINEILDIQKRYNIEVYLACKGGYELERRAKEVGIKVFPLPFRGNADIYSFFKIIKIIKEKDIDIVNTHSAKDTWIGGFAAKLTKRKFIRTRHTNTPINPSRFNFINELADFVITTGEHVRENMIKNNRISPTKIISIPSGVDKDRFDPKKYDKKNSREYFKLKDDELIIGHLARFAKLKGFDNFIEVAKNITQKFNNIRFVIGGDGTKDMREYIKNLIRKNSLEDNIILLGHIHNPEIFFKAIDIFFFPSKSEGVPQVVTQALMMNLPTVTTDVGGTKDLLVDNNFILVESNNIEQMSKELEKLIKDKSLRDKLSKRARKSVVDKFSIESMVDKTVYVYEQILNRKIRYEK